VILVHFRKPEEKVKVVGYAPTPHKFFVKNLTKNFFLKSMKCFCTKVFEVLRNFFQKVPKWGLGQRPKTKKTFSSPYTII